MDEKSKRDDEVLRVLTSMVAINKNLPEHRDVEESKVKIFHALLDRLEIYGEDVNEFRISSEDLHRKKKGPIIVRANKTEYNREFTKERYVEFQTFKTKLESTCMYLQTKLNAPSNPIGYEKDNR